MNENEIGLRDKIPRTYKHFKGGLYVSIDTVLDVSKDESIIMMIYLSMASDDHNTYARPVSNFFETVEFEDKTTPRFQLQPEEEDY